MKRFKALGLLPILCLAACNSSNYYGDYSFSLGKTDGSHFGFTVSLQKDDYEGKPGFKKMKISAEFGDDFSIASMIESYQEKFPLIGIVIDVFFKDIKNVSEINGYYLVMSDYANEKYGKRVSFGSEELTKMIQDSDVEIIKELGLNFDITPDIVEHFAVAYVNRKEFTFQIPVSMSDVQQQLLWYGYYIDPDNPTNSFMQIDLEKMPGAKGEQRYGTHPEIKTDKHGNLIEDQIEAVNSTYQYEFSRTGLYSKDDNTLIGKFIQSKNEDGEKVLQFIPKDETMSLTNIIGYVQTMDILGAYSKTEEIKFSVSNAETHETNVTYNHEEGTNEGFTDENGTAFRFTSFIQPPFVFRDFHDVKIGLKK